MEIKTEKTASLIGPNLAQRLFEFKLRNAALNAGYSTVSEWHETVPESWGLFPSIPFKRYEIYHGTRERFAYSHHQAIAKFEDQFIASWSNAPIHEDKPGQEVHYALSKDLQQWSDDRVLVGTDPSTGLVRNNAGLSVRDGQVYDFVGVIGGAKPAEDPSLTSFVPSMVRLDVYVTENLKRWTEHIGISEDVYLFEGPRRLQDGSYLCCGSSFAEEKPVVLIWPRDRHFTDPPQKVYIPVGDQRIKGIQGTWYQTDSGKIWMYIRDAGMSARLALSWSEDGGKTWSEVILTDMPNTCSRAHAGRLSDGRFYIIGNNYENLLDRSSLLIALSQDGETYDEMYTFVSGKTHRRIDGLHKEDGWHYPNSIVDGDKLIVVFSVNKEDIFCGIADFSQ